LRDRFGVLLKLELYEQKALEEIVHRSSDILAVEIHKDAAIEIARRSRGTPRIVNRILKRVRDYAQVFGEGAITIDIAKKALTMLEIDALGLDQVDHKLLMTIIENYDGGPVGLEALSASSGEEKTTIEDVYEPYLLQIGFMNRTPRGRVATRKAYQHLGLKVISEPRVDSPEDL
jgi:Holliday junction DNA helicase RuvB